MNVRLLRYTIGALAAAAVLVPAANAQNLVYGSPLPPKHVVNVEGIEPLIAQLKNTVPITLVAGGQLFGFSGALQSVGNRIADITTVVPSFEQSRLPNASIMFNAVLLVDHELVTQGAAEETIMLDCPECKADFIRNKTIYLGGYASSGMAFLCNKEVTKLDDLKGKKTRTSGAIGRWAAHLGAVPVSMTPGNMVEAINRGQIDCIGGFNAWYKSYPVSDSVKWIYSFPMGSTAAVGFMVTNLSAWKGLKLDQKKAVLAALPKANAKIVLGYVGEAIEARKLAKKNGVVMTNAEDRLNTIWEAYKKDEYQAIINTAKQAGSKDPKKVLDTYLKNLEKWRGIIKEAGLWDVRAGADNPPENLAEATDKFAALLNEHVYSKIGPKSY